MQVKILFNSTGVSSDYSTGWGVSFLIEGRVLFDTGEKGALLLSNIEKMDVDLSSVRDIIISHDHWDHTGGLRDILKKHKNINVYGCPGFGDEFRNKVGSNDGKLFEVDSLKEIYKDIYTTGEIIGKYKEKDISEQAVVVEGEKGLTVMTGCAHPGIVRILDEVQRSFPDKPFYAVFGGFHLMNKHPRNIHTIIEVFRKLGVRKAGPTHCSGTEAENIFKKEYGHNFLTVNVGEVIDV